MSSKGTRILPIRILKIWFDVVLILGGLAVLLFLGYLAFYTFLLAGSDLPSEAFVQVAVGERSWRPVHRLDLAPPESEPPPGFQNTRLVEATGELHLLTTIRWLQHVSLGEIMLASVILLYVIWLLRKVLINVLADRPFAAANGPLLQRSGYIVLILGVVLPPIDYLLSKYALSTITISNLDLRPAITLSKDVFVVGLMLIVFGLILDRGHQLQQHEQELEEEQALTI